MKATRKLIPAIAMLLISAVMMSTASFAWFSTNTIATANGFQVQIAAAKNLLIKDSAGSTYTSSVVYQADDEDANKLNLNPASMDPSAITNTTGPKFYSLDSVGETPMDPDNYAASSTTTFAETEVNYVKKTVNLNATGEYDENKTNFGDVIAKITVGGTTTSPVMPSLRILIVVTLGTTTNAFLYAPITGAASSYSPVNGTNSDSLGTEIKSYSNNTTSIITGITKETPYTVDIYMWFEGQDPACKATNAIKLVANTVTINFELDGSKATGTGA